MFVCSAEAVLRKDYRDHLFFEYSYSKRIQVGIMGLCLVSNTSFGRGERIGKEWNE
jgi:hypothetical protein